MAGGTTGEAAGAGDGRRAAQRAPEPGVGLPSGESGSAFLGRLLREAAARRPALFADAAAALEPGRFRAGFGEAVVRFEAARVASDERIAVAREIAADCAAALRFRDAAGERPLSEALAESAAPLALSSQQGSGAGGLAPVVRHEGRTYRGEQVRGLCDALQEAGCLTDAASRALRWTLDRARDEGGAIDLRGRRFAVLGAAAELSPVPLLLEAGADVIWFDLAAPPDDLAKRSELSGRLHAPPGGADLLARPGEIAATLARCADAGPLDLGLYAYAAGGGREWRLAAAMNAIAETLPAGALASVSLLISPTAPLEVQPEDARRAAQRLAEAPLWQRALRAAGRLPDAHCGGVARSVVRVQGAAYQGAQYVAKGLAAEGWLADGIAGARPTISANVAAITRTRSLSTPIFQAGFAGAPAFRVTTLAPETSRALNALLLLHDLLNPQAPGAGSAPPAEAASRARALRAQQIHGGLACLPYALDPALTAAALIGFARRPGLVAKLLGR